MSNWRYGKTVCNSKSQNNRSSCANCWIENRRCTANEDLRRGYPTIGTPADGGNPSTTTVDPCSYSVGLEPFGTSPKCTRTLSDVSLDCGTLNFGMESSFVTTCLFILVKIDLLYKTVNRLLLYRVKCTAIFLQVIGGNIRKVELLRYSAIIIGCKRLDWDYLTSNFRVRYDERLISNFKNTFSVRMVL